MNVSTIMIDIFPNRIKVNATNLTGHLVFSEVYQIFDMLDATVDIYKWIHDNDSVLNHSGIQLSIRTFKNINGQTPE